MLQQRISLLMAVSIGCFGFLIGALMVMFAETRSDVHRMQSPHAAIELVNRAHKLVSQDDIAAFDIMDDAPSFYQGDLYIFVLARDGVNLYHAADRTLIGTNFASLKDVAGRPFGQKLIADISPHGVWHAWQWDNPASGRREWKLTFARQTEQGHIVAAGLYGGGVVPASLGRER